MSVFEKKIIDEEFLLPLSEEIENEVSNFTSSIDDGINKYNMKRSKREKKIILFVIISILILIVLVLLYYTFD